MLETIGFSRSPTEEELSGHLRSLFPALSFRSVTLDGLTDLEQTPQLVLYLVQHTASEFPVFIELFFPQKERIAEREQYIAQHLSQSLHCRTIVGYQPEGSSTPYYNLIFEREKVFLANDLNSKLAGDGENEVEIVRPFDINWKYSFDKFGNAKAK
jgi:hypothetical protein